VLRKRLPSALRVVPSVPPTAVSGGPRIRTSANDPHPHVAALVLACSSAYAQSDTIYLSCSGTEQSILSADPDYGKPSPYPVTGLSINLTTRTITGLRYLVRFDKEDEASISFKGGEGTGYIRGSIDRVTGVLVAMETQSKAQEIFAATQINLMCKRARPAF
jgi:hypothetical protein